MATTDIGIRVLILGVGEARRSIGAINDDLTKTSATIKQLSGTTSQLGQNLVSIGSAFTRVGRSLTLTLTTPLLGLNAALTGSGIAFEDAFAGVTKTVDGLATGFHQLTNATSAQIGAMGEEQKNAIFTSKAFGQLTEDGQNVRDTFRKMALDIPISATELAKVGEVAGQLGVSKDIIDDFTKTMAFMGVATNMSAEQSATSIAHLGNILGITGKDLQGFAEHTGSTIVALGNQSASTESEISNMALRIASAGRLVGLNTPEILGLSTAISDMGVRAELGGTAISRMMMEMVFAVADGGEELDEFARVAGLSASDFASSFRKDPLPVMSKFLEQLAKLQESGGITKDQLTAMGLSGVRVRDVMARLGPNMEFVRQTIERSNIAWTENIALEEEAQKRFKTVKSQLILLKNTFVDLGITIFDTARNDIVFLIDKIKSAVNWFRELDPAIRTTVVRISLIAAAIGPALVAIGTLTHLLGMSMISFKSLTSLFGYIDTKNLDKTFSSIKKKTGKLSKGNLFKAIFDPITNSFKNLFGIFSAGFEKTFTFIGKTIPSWIFGGVQKATKGIGTIANFLFSGILNSFVKLGSLVGSSFLGPLAEGFAIPFKILNNLIGTLLKGAFSGLSSVVGVAGTLFGSLSKYLGGIGKVLLSWIPLFGKQLPYLVFGFFGKLPLLIGASAVALTALFAPKVITQLVKNWSAVTEATKTSLKAFSENLKTRGLEKSLLVFANSGVERIAKALGASSDHAKRFSYALGTATYWLIRIWQTTKTLVSSMFMARKETEGMSKGVQSTGERLITFMSSVAKFLEGFFNGWNLGFTRMNQSAINLVSGFRRLFSSLDSLFEAIFGKAQESAKKTFSELEPGVRNGALAVGETVGEVLSKIVAGIINITALLVEATAAVVRFTTRLIEAGKDEGTVGVLKEIGSSLSGLWDGIKEATKYLWDEVKDPLNSFLTTIVNWISNEGLGAIRSAFSSVISAIGNEFDKLWNGAEEKVNKTETDLIDVFKDNKFIARINKSVFTDIDAYKRSVLGSMLPGDVSNLSFQPVTLTETTPATEGIRDQLAKVFTGLEKDIKALWRGFSTYAGMVWSGTEDIKGLEDHLNDLLGAISKWITATGIPAIKTYGTQLAEGLAESLSDTLKEKTGVDIEALNRLFFGFDKNITNNNSVSGANEEAAKWVGGIGAAMSGAANDQQETVNKSSSELGQSVPKGILGGILAVINQPGIFSNPLLLKMQELYNSVKNFLQAGSPSRLFMSLGQSIVDGLILGLTSKQSALSSVANAIVNIFRGMQSTIASAVGSITNYVNTVQNQVTMMTNTTAAIKSIGSGAVNALSGAARTISSINWGALQPQSPKTLLQHTMENLEKYMKSGSLNRSFNPLLRNINTVVPSRSYSRSENSINFSPTVNGVQMNSTQEAYNGLWDLWQSVQAGA